MCCIVTMHMGKTMRVSRGVATGCLNSESIYFIFFGYVQCTVNVTLFCNVLFWNGYRELMHIVFVHYLEVKV